MRSRRVATTLSFDSRCRCRKCSPAATGEELRIFMIYPGWTFSVEPGRRYFRTRRDDAEVDLHFLGLHQQDRCRDTLHRASSLRDRAPRFRPSVFLTMTCLQGCDHVDEACSFSRVHLTLPHPAVLIRIRDDSLRLAEFGSMHFEKGGVCSEVSAVAVAGDGLLLVALTVFFLFIEGSVIFRAHRGLRQLNRYSLALNLSTLSHGWIVRRRSCRLFCERCLP